MQVVVEATENNNKLIRHGSPFSVGKQKIKDPRLTACLISVRGCVEDCVAVTKGGDTLFLNKFL